MKQLKKLNWHRISQVLSLVLILNLLFASLIPNLYRWILITLIGILDLLVYFWVSKSKDRKKINRIHVWIKLALIILILFPNAIFTGFIRALSVKTETYEINFVSLDATELNSIQELNGQKVGILSDETSKIGYIYPKQISEDNDLSLKFVEYNSYIEAIQALQNGKINIIVLPGGYEKTFGSIDDFKMDTSVLHTIWQETFKEKVNLYLPEREVMNIRSHRWRQPPPRQ